MGALNEDLAKAEAMFQWLADDKLSNSCRFTDLSKRWGRVAASAAAWGAHAGGQADACNNCVLSGM